MPQKKETGKEEIRERVVKRVKFGELTPEMQAQMRGEVQPKKKEAAALKPAAQIDQQLEPTREAPMTLERAKKLMSNMSRAKRLDFIREIINKKDPPIHRDIIIAIGQSAMAGMDKTDRLEFINIIANAQKVERDKLNAKREGELIRRMPIPEAATPIEEKEDSVVAQTERSTETTLTLPNSAEDQAIVVPKAPVKPKTSVHRANGTKPKRKGKKHSAVVTQNHKAAKAKPADVPDGTQATETIESEATQTEIIQPEPKVTEQQILPGTVISSAPSSLSEPLPPIQDMTQIHPPAKKKKATNEASSISIKKGPTKASVEAVTPVPEPANTDFRRKIDKTDPRTIDVGEAPTVVTKIIPTPVPKEQNPVPEREEVKIITKGNLTTIQVGAQAFSLSDTKLVRMLDGSIKLEVVAEKVIVKETFPLPEKANGFEMMFGFEAKTEVEKIIEKPGTGKVMFVGDMDNFTSYLRYQPHVPISNIVKHYIKGREMLVKPQYFVSCMHVPSPFVHSYRDRYTHQVMATDFFNVEWKRIKKIQEDDSMYDPDLPTDLKARPRGYGDADVARFLLQQDNLEKCETILLMTHDEHFTSTVKYLRSIGKIVELYHTGRWWTSTNLRNACDTETDITVEFPAEYPDHIFNELEKRKLNK